MIRILLKLEARYQRAKHRHRVAALMKQFKDVGPGFQIGDNFLWRGAEAARIGDNCFINRGAFINSDGGLTMGDNVVFGPCSVIWTVDHQIHGNKLPYDEERIFRPVTIERNIWAGFGVTVTPGTTIGEGAVIGAGTVVSGQVPPMAIIAGQKWRQIAERDHQHYERLVQT